MNTNDECVLRASKVAKSFRSGNSDQAHRVLTDVSLDLNLGEWVALMGASGSGKTTFLNCASGIMRPDEGDVVIAGKNLTLLGDDEKATLRRKNLAYVFQDYNLIDEITVEQNIALPLALDGAENISKRVSAAMDRIGIADLGGKRASVLSGGEKQRVALARAIAQAPLVLFADEPTGALDSITSEKVLQTFGQLKNAGISILMVTHDIHAASKADRAVILRDGQISASIANPTEEQIFDLMRRGQAS